MKFEPDKKGKNFQGFAIKRQCRIEQPYFNCV